MSDLEKVKVPVEFVVGLPFSKKAMMVSIERHQSTKKSEAPKWVPLPPGCIQMMRSSDDGISLCGREVNSNSNHGFLCPNHGINVDRAVTSITQGPMVSQVQEILNIESKAIEAYGVQSIKMDHGSVGLKVWSGPNPPPIPRTYDRIWEDDFDPEAEDLFGEALSD